MRVTLLVPLVLGTLRPADEPPPATKEEMKKLEGTWTVVRARRDGEVDSDLIDAVVTLAGSQFTSKSGKAVVARGAWKIDPAKKPRTLDIEYKEGPEKGQTAYGIYSLTDDTWVVLLSAPGKERPVSFERESETGRTFLVLKQSRP
jgi:uncharacterized protein (TIGR03067 family)